MSLEQSISDLTTQAGLLLDLPASMAATANAKITSLTTRYDNILASQYVSVYVDAIAGNDANSGTNALPLKTIQAALDLTPRGGICFVFLKTDYHVDSDILISNKVLSIRNAGGPMPSLTFAKFTYQVGALTYRSIRHFEFLGASHLFLLDIKVYFPDTSLMTAYTPDNMTIMRCQLGNAAVSLVISTCELHIPNNIMCRFFGGANTLIDLLFFNVTYPGAITNPNGYLSDAQTNTAGVATAGLSWIRTNLATI
jgi:hypothetical protein